MTRNLVVSFALAALLGACSTSEPPAATTTAVPAAAPAAASPTAATPAGATGIADCDQFLSAYEQCVMDKMPEQARAQMQLSLDQWKTAWRDMANNSATKGALPQICQQARDASRASLQAYGCTL